VIVSLKAPFNATTVRDFDRVLRARGGRVSSYFPEDSLLIIGDEAAIAAVAGSEAVAGLGDFLPQHKVGGDPHSTAALTQQQTEDTHPLLSSAILLTLCLVTLGILVLYAGGARVGTLTEWC
jgi:hypothetical protein